MFLLKTVVLRKMYLYGVFWWGPFIVDLNRRVVLNTVGKSLSLTEHTDDGGRDQQLTTFQPKSFLKTLPTFAPKEVESISVKMFHFFDPPSANCVSFHRWPRPPCCSWDRMWRERNAKTEILSTCSYTR